MNTQFIIMVNRHDIYLLTFFNVLLTRRKKVGDLCLLHIIIVAVVK